MKLMECLVERMNRKEYEKIRAYRSYYDDYDPCKDPRLDDEGTYDYYAEYMPPDNQLWYYDREWKSKCESCGCETRLYKVYTHTFRCWDGWDSDSYTECWKCDLQSRIRYVTRNIKVLKLIRRYKRCKKKSIKNPLKYIFNEELWVNTAYK